MARELGGRRPGTATGQCRRLYQSICPSSKAQQLEAPDAHICRFSPCGQYLICFAGGFTQLVVYRFTGPRLSWQGERDDAELAAMLASFSCFFTPLYRVQLAPAGEVLARDVVLFMGGGGLLLTASHSPFAPPPAPPPPDGDPLLALPFAESITLHLVRLSDGVRVGGSRLEGELVDLSGRPGARGIVVHEDLIAVLGLRSQVVHLLQVLRGGEEVVPVRSLGPHVAEDDELVLRTAQEAEERWRRARRAEREAGGRDPAAATALQGLPRPPAGAATSGEDVSLAPLLPPLRRSYNGDLVRAAEVPPVAAAQAPAATAAAAATATTVPASTAASAAAAALAVPAPGMPSRHHAAAARPEGPAAVPGAGARPTGRSPPPPWLPPPGYGAVGLGAGPVVDGAGGSGDAAGRLAPPPVAVLYPPDRSGAGRSPAAGGAVGGGSQPPAAGDYAAAAAAHQAAVRLRVRQQQYEQLEAQGGPGQPPPPVRRIPPRDHANGTALASRDATAAANGGGGGDGGPSDLLSRQPHQQPQQPQQGLRGGGVQQLHPHHHHRHNHPHPNQQHHHHRHPRQQSQPPHNNQHPLQQQQQPGPGPGRVLLPPDAGGGGGYGGGGFITGIKQRLLAHLYGNCLRAHPNNPKRQQREALALFRQLDAFRSLLMRKIYVLDRRRLLIDLRKPSAADLGPAALGGAGAGAPPGAAPGMPPSQFFLLFDLQDTRVLRFEPCPGECVIESYIREVSSAAEYPWAESLAPWDRYVYDNALTAARNKLRIGGGGGGPGVGVGGTVGAAGSVMGPGAAAADAAAAPGGGPSAASAAAERASCASKLMQLLPPLSGSGGLSSSPYLDTVLYNYDERVVSPYIRTRPCLEQPVFFRLRNRPDRAVFRLDPGPYEAMVVRDRRLARSVTHHFHPDAPFVLAVFSVFQQSSLNINFRL